MKALGCQAAWIAATVLILLNASQAAGQHTELRFDPWRAHGAGSGDANQVPFGRDEDWSNAACREPAWTVTADALFLHRSDPGSFVLIENTADPTENLNTGQLDLGVHTGVELSLTQQLTDYDSLEIRYFGVDQWSTAASIPTTPGDLLRLNTAVPLFVDAGDSIDARYTSELHSFEINGLTDLTDRLTLLGGFRYLELDEHLQATLVNSLTPFGYGVNTRNRLYGFQLGGRFKFWESCCQDDCSGCCECGRLTIDGIGKAGVFGNALARQSAVSTFRTVVPSSLPVRPRTAFVGELGVTAKYRLRNCLSVRAGYRLLWVDGVALASDQAPVTAFLPPALAPRPAIDTSTVFYHGAFVGLQYQW